MAIRSHSVPLQGSDGAAAVVNPFYSQKLQEEIKVEAARPRCLPSIEPSPAAALHDAGEMSQCAMEPSGKGRGGTGMFETPSSWNAGRPVVYGPRQPPHGIQSQGSMPSDQAPQTMCNVATHVEKDEKVDDLQRELEVELVEFLKQQNSKLMEEVRRCWKLKRL